MKILVLNCGSSSLKFQLIDTNPDRIAADSDIVLAQGSIEKIGSGEATVTYEQQGSPKTREGKPILKHKEAIQTAFEYMTGEHGVVQDLREIEGVGHRVVHGGEDFRQSVLIDEGVLKKIEAAVELAPLHVPHNLKGYYAAVALLPHAKNVAVFDTSFHQTMPAYAFLYGVPYLYYRRDKMRRYGFHGTSHRYVSYRFAKLQGKNRSDFKLISCHLGNGCSVCAIDHGKSVDTSMGMTPLEGLLMGTRPGDLDAGAVMYLVEHAEMGLHEVDVLLNKHSGLYGVSGVSNDMRDVIQASRNGNHHAKLAVDMFCYRVKKYIGSYLAAMNGADALLFTGGIGENSAYIRAQICAGMDWLGVSVDGAKNQAAVGKDADISGRDARIQTWVIPTNEELLIARDTQRAIENLPQP
jgi:acetate kinase